MLVSNGHFVEGRNKYTYRYLFYLSPVRKYLVWCLQRVTVLLLLTNDALTVCFHLQQALTINRKGNIYALVSVLTSRAR